MFSFFKKKKIVAHLKLSGVIGNAGKFKQGIDFAGQEELIKKAFSLKTECSVKPIHIFSYKSLNFITFNLLIEN